MGGNILSWIVALWRNGSASDSRSEGCVFKSRQGHSCLTTKFKRDTVQKFTMGTFIDIGKVWALVIILRRQVNRPISHFLRPQSQSRNIELPVVSSNNIGGGIHTDWYNPPIRRKRSDNNNNVSLRPQFFQCTALLYIATKTTIPQLPSFPEGRNNLQVHNCKTSSPSFRRVTPTGTYSHCK